MTDILNLQAGIEAFTNPAEATAEVTAINAGTDTVAAYAAKLAVANAGQSEAVMLTISLMQGGTPTAGKLLSPTSPANEFQHLTITYLPTQQAFAVKNGLPIIIYNAEVVALGTGASGDGTQNNFLKNFGSSKLTLAQFETTLEGLTLVSAAAIDAQYKFFLNLYGSNLPASLPASYPNADAAARAVTFGFAVGTDLANPALNPTLISQLENAKVLNAETINGDVSGAAGYQNNVAIGSQPKALPLQGGTPTPPPSPTNVFLTTGVDNPTQGFSTSATGTPPLTGFVATANNTTFNGTVGGAGATWTAGDQVTAVAGTTGQTFNLVGIGAPGAINVTSVGPGNKVSNIQTVNITAASAMGVPSQAIQGDFTAAGPEGEWTGLTALNVQSASTATAADNLTVGPAVAVQVTDTAISAPPNLPLATGPFLTVNGGSTVTINENNLPGINLHSIIVNGGSGTKSVTITQTETNPPNQDYARVNINDVNGASTTAAGTITTVVLDGLAHFLGITKGPNMIVDNALTNLTVNNSEANPMSGTDLLIVNNLTTPTATTLNLSLGADGVNAGGMGVNFLVLTDVKNEYSTVHLSLGAQNSVLFFTDNGLATLDTTMPGTGALVGSINDAPPVIGFPGSDGTFVPAGPSTINDSFAGNVKIDLSGLNGPNNLIVDRGATVNNDSYTLGNFGTDNKGPTTSQSLMIKDTQLGNVDTINFGSGAYNIVDAPHTANHSYVNTAPDGAGLAGLPAQQFAGISNTKPADTLTFKGDTVQAINNAGPQASLAAGLTAALFQPQHTATAFQFGGNTFIFDHAGTANVLSPTDSLVSLIGVAFNANTISPGGIINFA
jgi:hypothetical protein